MRACLLPRLVAAVQRLNLGGRFLALAVVVVDVHVPGGPRPRCVLKTGYDRIRFLFFNFRTGLRMLKEMLLHRTQEVREHSVLCFWDPHTLTVEWGVGAFHPTFSPNSIKLISTLDTLRHST